MSISLGGRRLFPFEVQPIDRSHCKIYLYARYLSCDNSRTRVYDPVTIPWSPFISIRSAVYDIGSCAVLYISYIIFKYHVGLNFKLSDLSSISLSSTTRPYFFTHFLACGHMNAFFLLLILGVAHIYVSVHFSDLTTHLLSHDFFPVGLTHLSIRVLYRHAMTK